MSSLGQLTRCIFGRGFHLLSRPLPSSMPRLTTPVAGVPRIQPPLLQRDQLFAPECLQDAIDVYGGQGTRRASGRGDL
jgi:hypothetical protein